MRSGLSARFGRAFAILLLVSSSFLSTPTNAAAAPQVLLVGSYHGIAGQYSSIQAAVNAAQPGDWILVGPGDYHETGSPGPEHPAGVLVTTPGIHLRGMDRNRVIVDGTLPGGLEPCSPNPALQVPGRDGIVVWKASGTYVENLTACNFLTSPNGGHGNQIWWNGGDGSGKIGMGTYWGNYLTATSTYSNGVEKPRGEYGLFVSNASGPGSVNYSYASNMGDAAIYVGACPNCNAVLNHDRGTLSALGYSGTNSGGNLIIENTEFDHNLSGLVSNSQNNDDQPSPQIGLCPTGSKPTVAGAAGCTIFMHNSVHDNNNPNVPGAGASGLAGSAPVGSGIVLAGTAYVTLYQNRVFNNGAWGILVADLPDQESAPPGFPECTGGVWSPPPAGVCYYFAFGNYTWANTLWNNGFFGNPTNGDMGLATQPHNPGNCFHANTDPGRPGGQPSMDPPNLQSGAPYYPCGQANGGDFNVLAAEALCATQLLAPCPNLPGFGYPRTTGVTLSMPPPQPTMADPCAGAPRNAWCP
jgi:hypothetical protein